MARAISRNVKHQFAQPSHPESADKTSAASGQVRTTPGFEDRIIDVIATKLAAGFQELLSTLRSEQGRRLPAQEWFSIDETAALTGLSADHVRRHVTSGTLPASNQGTFDKPYYRIRRQDIDGWMDQRRVAPQPAPRKKPSRAAYASRHHAS